MMPPSGLETTVKIALGAQDSNTRLQRYAGGFSVQNTYYFCTEGKQPSGACLFFNIS